jgi:hypothetical protein
VAKLRGRMRNADAGQTQDEPVSLRSVVWLTRVSGSRVRASQPA